jgi:hypothetical protein
MESLKGQLYVMRMDSLFANFKLKWQIILALERMQK